MIKLLNAGFVRLRKNKLFWLLFFFSVGFALFMLYANYSNMRKYGDVIEIEQDLLNYAQLIGIIASIFTSLFLGVEYSDGGIRNKISIGHKRIDLYLSNLIIVMITNVVSYILFCIVILLIGIPLFGPITMPIIELCKLVCLIILVILSYSALFTFIAMLVQNKTISAVVSILFSFGFLMFSLTCFRILEEPKFIQSATMVDNEMKFEEVANPKYPSENKKKVCQLLLDINPSGQSLQIARKEAINLNVLPLYSLGVFVVFTSLGIVLFKKCELK